VDDFFSAVWSGLMIGSLYALMAIGLSMTWGMLKVINLAHFAMILLGAYLTYALVTTIGVDPLLTIVVTAPLMFAAGAALQWGFQRFRVTEFNSLLISFGVLIIVIQTISNVWTADFRRMGSDVNPYAAGALSLGPLEIVDDGFPRNLRLGAPRTFGLSCKAGLDILGESDADEWHDESYYNM
jgi:branched-chain amino acid transport system permease protein